MYLLGAQRARVRGGLGAQDPALFRKEQRQQELSGEGKARGGAARVAEVLPAVQSATRRLGAPAVRVGHERVPRALRCETFPRSRTRRRAKGCRLLQIAGAYGLVTRAKSPRPDQLRLTIYFTTLNCVKYDDKLMTNLGPGTPVIDTV